MINNLKWIALGMAIGIIMLVTTTFFQQEINAAKNLLTTPVTYDNKTITIGRTFDSIALDPAVTIDQESARVTVNIYETLVAMEHERVVPALAKSWTVSEDGLTWKFTLQDDVYFHDGSIFDAKSVTFNFNRWMDETSPYHAGDFQYWNIIFGDFPCLIKSVQALSDNIVEIKLNKPYAPFLSTLAMPAFGIASPNAIVKYNEGLKFKPVGTGPYVLESWAEDGEITLERNMSYWGEPAKIGTLIFKTIPESEGRIELLKNGDLQLLDNLTISEIEQLSDSKNIQLVKRPFSNVGYLAMNLDNRFLANKDVRLSINSVIKTTLNSSCKFNSYSRHADTFVPPGLWGSNNALRQKYIPIDTSLAVMDNYSEAQKHLRLLVMKEPRPYFPEPMKLAKTIQRALEPLGIEVDIIELPWNVFMATIQQGEYDLLLMGWIADVMDPDNFLYTFFSSENISDGLVSNYSRYKNKKVDELLTRARQTTDLKFRESLYREAQEIIHDDLPAIPLVNTITVVGVDKNILNFVPTSSGLEPLNTIDYKMEP
ncbi:MAG: ABC transporter substrate-binding protein [Clostridia bacterium]|nr:ABC transporter substrate-binding protein [Clostridia bacterium]